jgi:hypothetical protein
MESVVVRGFLNSADREEQDLSNSVEIGRPSDPIELRGLTEIKGTHAFLSYFVDGGRVNGLAEAMSALGATGTGHPKDPFLYKGKRV